MRAAGTGMLGDSTAAARGSAATGNGGGLPSAGDRYKWVRIDWAGNLTFGLGAGALLTAITYGIQPYGGQPTGWANPWVLAGLAGGAALLAAFGVIETEVADPMFRMGLFKIRAFAAGNTAALLASAARGGLQFMLVIWWPESGRRCTAMTMPARRCRPGSTCCR